MSAISTVLWDVGSTLMKSVVPVQQFIYQCLEVNSIPLAWIDSATFQKAEQFRRENEPMWRTLHEEKEGFYHFATILLGGTEASEEQIRRFAACLSYYYDIWSVVPGIPALLAELREAGIVQGVVSNWPPSLRRILQHHRLASYFQVIAGSGELGVNKPDTSIFLWALRKLGVAAEECIYIGDNPVCDIEPAKSLGMQAIHFDPQGRYEVADARDVAELRSLLGQWMMGVTKAG